MYLFFWFFFFIFNGIFKIDEPADAVHLNLEWRRHDRKPEWKKFIIVHEATGDQVQNIHRIYVGNERCEIAFGPVSHAGKYLFYYLPFEPQEGHGSYSKNYLKKESKADASWIKKNKLNKKALQKEVTKATIVAFESRTAFDSFYPMEVIALKTEREQYLKKHKQAFHLFAEDRAYPVRMQDNIPQ